MVGLAFEFGILQHYRNKWCEAGSAVPISQPAVPLAQNVLKSALAGGIACSFSAFVMHPVDTIKAKSLSLSISSQLFQSYYFSCLYCFLM